MIGQRLLHYEIVEKLGEGGMGVVYKARDTHLDRFVALKVLPPEKVADPERKARFVQEAKAASALNHGNIVTIYDIALDHGTDFIAMEYVAGKTLDQLIPRKGMRLNEALKIALQIAGALARAHAAGILHRDLKPSNVMIDERSGVKLLDFGLAKLIERATSGDATTAPIGVKTDEGTVVGTVAYMSPEQAQGRSLDGRSDIFSFGAVLYEMLAGRRAFQGNSKISVLSAILREEPPPLPEELPFELRRLVERCLRKDPDRRFQHMDDVQVALQDVKEDSDSGKRAAAAPAADKKSRKLVWIVTAGVFVGLLAVGGWFLRPRPVMPVPQFRTVPLTANPGIETDPCFSPDGSSLAYSWNGEKQDNFDIYVKLIGPGNPLRLTTNPDPEYAPAWSPDGRWIAFLRVQPGVNPGTAAVMLIPALGGPERKIGEINVEGTFLQLYCRLAWTNDSNGLVVPHAGGTYEERGLFLLPLDGGVKRRLTSGSSLSPTLSPTGQRVVFVRIQGISTYDLYLLDLSNDLKPQGEPKQLTAMREAIASPAWTVEGREIVFSSGGHFGPARSLWRVAASPGNIPKRVSLGEEAGQLAISRNNRRLVYCRNSWNVDIWGLKVGNRTKVAGSPAKLRSSIRPEYIPEYSPDGKQIAFNSHRSGAEEVWRSDADGTHALPLTSVGGPMVSCPRWSPDGKTLAVHSMVGGERGIDLFSADGGPFKRVAEGGCNCPTWSRDGQWVYFGKQGQVWKVSRSGGDAIPVTRNGGRGTVFESADGKSLYYAKGPAAGGRIWQLKVAEREETQVVEQPLSYDMNFALVDDGLYLIAADRYESSGELYFHDFASHGLTKLLTIPRWSLGLTVSPDGRTILYSQRGEESGSLMVVENFQ